MRGRADDRLAAGESGQGGALFPQAGGRGEALNGWNRPDFDSPPTRPAPQEGQGCLVSGSRYLLPPPLRGRVRVGGRQPGQWSNSRGMASVHAGGGPINDSPSLRIRTILLAVALLTIPLRLGRRPGLGLLPPPALDPLGPVEARTAPAHRPRRAATTLTEPLEVDRASSPDGKGVGIPIYVDPAGLGEAGAKLASAIEPPPPVGVSIRTALEDSLRPLGMGYYVEDGLLRIATDEAADRALRERPKTRQTPLNSRNRTRWPPSASKPTRWAR